MKHCKVLGTAGLFVVSTFGPVFAQPNTPAQASTSAQTATQSSNTASTQTNPDGTYATGKPLEQQSKEGFWGHMNPFARKKWVNRQIEPVRDRANELDELQAKNANDIRDVDARATTGIARANDAAKAADAHAADAANRADAANSLAVSANGKTTALNGTVSNLDQYSKVNAIAVTFPAGRTVLGAQAKQDLDGVAQALSSEKGYIVEVQGYSRAGVAHSQALADSVVRYLVVEHQVPIYRIYRTGLGKEVAANDADPNEKPLTNGVRVTVLHNSLAGMGSTTTSGTSKPPTTPASASPEGSN